MWTTPHHYLLQPCFLKIRKSFLRLREIEVDGVISYIELIKPHLSLKGFLNQIGWYNFSVQKIKIQQKVKVTIFCTFLTEASAMLRGVQAVQCSYLWTMNSSFAFVLIFLLVYSFYWFENHRHCINYADFFFIYFCNSLKLIYWTESYILGEF